IAGIELGAGVTGYSDARLSDNSHTSVGPFFRYQIGRQTDLRASFGFTDYQFDPSTFITNKVSSSGFYADVQFNHQVTDRTAQTINIGQSQSTDINSAPVQLIYVRYSAVLNIVRYWSFRPYLTYESGNESHSLVQENFDRYGGGLAISRQLTDKLSASFAYGILKKNSTLETFNYTQNRLVLNVLYQF
ncbi:MAG: hypothetical protein RLY20_2865, partial [Verrucomicrobiota bacterium]